MTSDVDELKASEEPGDLAARYARRTNAAMEQAPARAPDVSLANGS